MKDFKGKVAVITGAASGIGRGLVERCAEEGMKVVLADIEEKALVSTEKEMKATGASVLAVSTDVSKASSVEALAQRTLSVFGAVHLLCNNAGVAAGTTIWESTLADWQWVVGVNLWGVIHGVHFFVPIMIEQGDECHIVNTASVAGLTSGAFNGVYTVTKHGVVALSETLYRELTRRGTSIRVSVLCPGFVNTRIHEAARNRPIQLMNDPNEELKGLPALAFQAWLQGMAEGISRGMLPRQVADLVINAVREEKFYILANANSLKPAMQRRIEDILEERNPTIQMNIKPEE